MQIILEIMRKGTELRYEQYCMTLDTSPIRTEKTVHKFCMTLKNHSERSRQSSTKMENKHEQTE